jgi:hypothetical protein
VDSSAATTKAEEDTNKTVIASSYEKEKASVPENTLDGKPATYWSTSANNPWIRYTLKHEIKIGKVGIYWYAREQPVYPFDIEFSFDGIIWQQVYKGKNHQTSAMEYYKFEPSTANYIRIRCHGNNKTGFSAIRDVDIDGLK